MIDVTFSIISGTKHIIRLNDTITVSEIKQTLSMIVDSPPHTITLLHKARILKDEEKLVDLDFESRNFIAVGIRRKSLRRIKHTDGLDSDVNNVSPLRRIFGDSYQSIRRHFLQDPRSLPVLIAYIAQSDPVNGRLLSENPQILLRFLGITPEEFVDAINQQNHRNQQNPEAENTEITGENNSGIELHTENAANEYEQETGNQSDQTSQENPVPQTHEEHLVDTTNNEMSNISGTVEDSPSTHPENETVNNEAEVDVSSFLATMTEEDLLNLEIIISRNIPLEEALPVFIQNGKNLEATISVLEHRT